MTLSISSVVAGIAWFRMAGTRFERSFEATVPAFLLPSKSSSRELTVINSLSAFAALLVEEPNSRDYVAELNKLTLLVLLVHGHERSQLDGRKHALKRSSGLADHRDIGRAAQARSQQNGRDDLAVEALEVVLALGPRVGYLSYDGLQARFKDPAMLFEKLS